MIFIGGISSGMRQIEYTKLVVCGRCGSYGRYQVYMTYMYFSFFFIPLFKWNKRFFVKMSCCGTEYELASQVGRHLLHGESVEITEEDLTLCRDGSGNPWEPQSRAGGGLSSPCSKKCPACGYETGEDFTYCPKCGGRME